MRTAACALALTFAVCTANAADKNWVGMVSSNWFDDSNWSPIGVPAAGDTATITSQATIIVTGEVSLAALSLSQALLVISNRLIVTNLFWADQGGFTNGTIEI